MLRHILALLFIVHSPLIYSQDMPASTPWKVKQIEVDSTGILRWITIDEINTRTIVIQQFRWNKWVKVGEVEGKGAGSNTYEFSITPHSGENKFRVGYPDDELFSKSVKYRDPGYNYTEGVWKVKDKLELKRVSMYEIFDAYGNIVLKGEAQVIDVSKLKRGTYYINYDKEMGKFLKK